jgi:hypothetical protein
MRCGIASAWAATSMPFERGRRSGPGELSETGRGSIGAWRGLTGPAVRASDGLAFGSASICARSGKGGAYLQVALVPHDRLVRNSHGSPDAGLLAAWRHYVEVSDTMAPRVSFPSRRSPPAASRTASARRGPLRVPAAVSLVRLKCPVWVAVLTIGPRWSAWIHHRLRTTNRIPVSRSVRR